MLSKLQRNLVYTEYQPLYYTKELKNSYSGVSVCAGSLKGKNAIVTGAGSGIGLAIAHRLIAEGCCVVISGRNVEKLVEAVGVIGVNANRLQYIGWDQTEFDTLDSKITQAISMLPGERLDILVNNAGIFTDIDRNRCFRNVTEEKYDTIIRTNLKSTYLISKKTAELMIQQKNKGKIINIASICALFRNFKYSPYGISKAGIIALTRELNERYKNSGIIVNSIAPGSVATAMGHLGINDNIAKGCNVLNRTIMPEEIASMVAFLASDIGKYFAGQIITVSACEMLQQEKEKC